MFNMQGGYGGGQRSQGPGGFGGGGGMAQPGPGRPPWGGLSGALGVGQMPRTPAFFTFMQALQRGEQRAGMQQRPPEVPNFMQGPGGFDSGWLRQMAAPGLRPGMRGGMGMQTGMGFGRGRMSAMGLEPQARMPGQQGFGGLALAGGGRFAGLM